MEWRIWDHYCNWIKNLLVYKLYSSDCFQKMSMYEKHVLFSIYNLSRSEIQRTKYCAEIAKAQLSLPNPARHNGAIDLPKYDLAVACCWTSQCPPERLFFKIQFCFQVLLPITVIVLHQIGPILGLFGQYCPYWWPGTPLEFESKSLKLSAIGIGTWTRFIEHYNAYAYLITIANLIIIMWWWIWWWSTNIQRLLIELRQS